MKKNILSFIKNTYTKSFVLGLALSFIIAFSVQSVVASSQTLKFIPQQSGLINKIGSLTIGSATSASWIDPNSGAAKNSGLDCMTSKIGTERESCLDVQGAGAFSKLMVLDIPAFITNTLFLNNDGNSSTISGLPGGLVLENTGGDDSIMATGLQLNDGSGNFAPVNMTDMRGLCANNAGILYPCDILEPVETYHWVNGDWGTCSAANSASCTGQWITSGAGSCSGTYSIGTCRESTGGCLSGDISCSSGAWSSLPASCQNLTIQNCPEPTEAACNANPLCWWMNPVIPGNCSARTTSLECEPLVPIIDNCAWTTTGSVSCVGPTNSSDCLAQGGGIFPSCGWNSSNTTTQCSDSNPSTSAACTSQNGGGTCSWTDAGVSVATRTITCQNSSNVDVADQFCIDNVGPKDPTSSDDPNLAGGNFCAQPVNAICGNSNSDVNNQCSTGTYDASPADSSTHYLWSCLGSNGGTDVTDCQEVIPVTTINGLCNETINNGCTSGTFVDIPDSASLYIWSCEGSGGGSTDFCQKIKATSGGGGGTCGDSCSSNADCASGIYCWSGSCDNYGTPTSPAIC